MFDRVPQVAPARLALRAAPATGPESYKSLRAASVRPGVRPVVQPASALDAPRRTLTRERL